MVTKKEVKRKIRFKYVFNDDYSPEYANGAYGGLNTRGEVILNFFLERMAVPYEIIHEIESDGTLGIETGRRPDDVKDLFIRHVQQGVVLNIENAIQVRDFLNNAIEHAEKFKERKGENTNE